MEVDLFSTGLIVSLFHRVSYLGNWGAKTVHHTCVLVAKPTTRSELLFNRLKSNVQCVWSVTFSRQILRLSIFYSGMATSVVWENDRNAIILFSAGAGLFLANSTKVSGDLASILSRKPISLLSYGSRIAWLLIAARKIVQHFVLGEKSYPPFLQPFLFSAVIL